ncbi:MAG: response regulator [Fusobacteria bacterium]|nr:response regulator [Fusobacteriota bacterium]
MKKQDNELELRNKLMGLGESSVQKTYYPELLKKLKEIEKAEKNYHSIFENAIEGIFQTKINGEVLNINKSFYEIFSYNTEKEFLENVSSTYEIYKNKIDRDKLIEEIMKKKAISKYEVEILNKNGEVRWVSINAKLITDDNGEEIIEGSIIDITEEKKIKKELEMSRKKAETESRAKTLFLANMSHEIRTPLNGIVGNIELLKLTKTDLEQDEYIKNIDISIDNLVSIINDILDISKIEEGRYNIDNEKGNLKKIFYEVYDSFKNDMLKKNLTFEISVNDNIPSMLESDFTKIRQVLYNLISNSLKFTEKGYIKIKLNLLEITSKTTKVEIIVEDTGIGIIGDHKEIFNPFVQGDMSYTKKYKGAGLGLAICKKILDNLNGKIYFNSVPDKGTTFYVELTLNNIVNIVDTSNVIEKSERFQNEYEENKDIILVAEDNDIIRETFSILLKHKKYNVISVVNGKEAVEAYKKNKNIGLILMDIQMPIMNGIEATKEIKLLEEYQNNKINIIALTAYAMKEDREKIIKYGFDDYIVKPVKTEMLYEIVEKNMIYKKKS